VKWVVDIKRSGLLDFSWYNIPINQLPQNIPNVHKYIPNDHKIYQHLPLQGLPTFTLLGIFGLKIFMASGNPEKKKQQPNEKTAARASV
jgi:hypothetical protein